MQKVADEAQLLMTDRLDAKALQRLQKGGNVLLSFRKGSLPAEAGGEVAIGFFQHLLEHSLDVRAGTSHAGYPV